MPRHFTGGCMCGAIRYKCSADPIAMGNCHCRDCQQATGSAFVAGVAVLGNAMTITGDVKYYQITSERGRIIRRGFCPNCGSRLFSQPETGSFMVIMAGSLDDPSWFRPEMDFYVSSAQPWDYMNPDLPKYAKFPQCGLKNWVLGE